MSRPFRIRCFRALTTTTVLVAGVALVAGCSSTAPSATGTPSSIATQRAVTRPALSAVLNRAVHSVTQEGLAIALASNVLQTQLALVNYSSTDTSGDCTALAGGGSSNRSGITAPSDSVAQITVNTFYDSACAQKYLAQDATVTSDDNDNATVVANTTYFAKSGATLGTLTTNASASFSDALQLAGVGTFTASVGGKTASLGLACQGTSSDTVLNCQGGIAQTFAQLGQSLGSITPLTLNVGSDVSDPISFTGSGRTTSTAKPGTLSVTDPGSMLALSGAATQSTAAVTTGTAGGFVLFPATPTGWTVTDQPDDVVFAISVTDNTTRSLTASVMQISTKKVLASLSLDQSGTGTVTYKGEKPTAVTSWILSN